MQPTHPQNPAHARMRAMMVPRILWGAMLFSVILYIFIGKFITGGREDLGREPNSAIQPFYEHPFFIPLLAVACMTFVMAFILPNIIVKNMKPNPANPNPYFVPFIVRIALFEAVAMYGLVFAKLSGQFEALLVFTVPAVIGIFLSQPKDEFLGFKNMKPKMSGSYPTAE